MKFKPTTPIPIEHQRDLEERILLFSESIEQVSFACDAQAIAEVEVHYAADRAPHDLDDSIRRIIDDVQVSSRKIVHKTVFEHEVPVACFDPQPGLLESRQIVATAPGEYVFQGAFLRLMQALDGLAARHLRALGCVEQAYPSFLNATPLFALNYYETMSQHIFFPVSLKGSYDTIAGFCERHKRANNPQRKLALQPGEFDQPRVIASPTVCFHCFSALCDSQIPVEGLAFTGIARCHREERSALRGLERLQSFTMREGIFVGNQEFVRERFEQSIALVKRLYAEELGLKFRIRSANDPFFGRVGALSQIFQSAMDLKYEVQVYLPYCDRYLACGSVNNHMSTMADAFGFSFLDGASPSPVSMCIGIGFERLALALMAQRGQLPEPLLAALGERLSGC